MSNIKPFDYAKLLSILAKQVEKLSESDLEKVLQDQAELKVSVQSIKSPNKNLRPVTLDIGEVIEQLNNYDSRDEAFNLLKSINKRELEVIAKSLEIAIQRSDKIDEIRKKIIESTVGAKLRSSIIRGTTPPKKLRPQ